VERLRDDFALLALSASGPIPSRAAANVLLMRFEKSRGTRRLDRERAPLG